MTFTPASIRFLASSVLGPLAGVMSTLELRSLAYRKRCTSFALPSDEALPIEALSFLLADHLVVLH